MARLSNRRRQRNERHGLLELRRLTSAFKLSVLCNSDGIADTKEFCSGSREHHCVSRRAKPGWRIDPRSFGVGVGKHEAEGSSQPLLLRDVYCLVMAEIVSTGDTLSGAPRIEGRRIGVHHIATRVLDAGDSPEQVAADYDIDIADVYRALVYYYDHVDEMRQIQAERQSPPPELSVVHGPEDLDTTPQSEPDT